MAEEEEVEVVVKHLSDVLRISLPATSRIKHLMELLQSRTGVLPRGQKLIFKGNVLNAEMSLAEAKIVSNSKIMLVASEGIHAGTKQQTKPPARRVIPVNPKPSKAKSSEALIPTKRIEAWNSSGIIALSEIGLQEIPVEVWAVGNSARLLELSRNCLQCLPSDIKLLVNLKKLNISSNCLTDDGVDWQSICSLNHLAVLQLDYNCLSCLPSEIQELSSLKELSVTNNKLTVIPDEVGKLRQLQKLNLSCNRVMQLPFTVGECTSLLELDVSANLLAAIPSTVSGLKNLKVLVVDNNALDNFPSEILKECVELISLSLHGNHITIETLREMDGWKEYDERRKAKYTKQLEFEVMGSGFDEGGDTHNTRHW